MHLVAVYFQIIPWIYGDGKSEFLKAWFNIHWFLYHFFSIAILTRTLFRPFHRMKEGYGRGFHPEKFFEALITNIVMRFVGFFARGVIILAALAVQLFILGIGSLLFLIFLTTPIFIFLAMFTAIVFIFF